MVIGEVADPPREVGEGAGAVPALDAAVMLGLRSLAEDAGRLEDEDEGQDQEDEELRPAGVAQGGRGVLDEADDEAAEHGAGDVADAAEDGGGERLESGVEPEVEADIAEAQAPHDAGGRREGATEEERQGDRLVHVDAHEGGRLAVLGRRAHRAAHARPAHEELEGGHQARGRGRR